MRTFLRWWETLDRPERIVAMSLVTGGVVTITNSTVWAIATCYMAHQKALVALRTQPGQPAASSDPHATATDARGSMQMGDTAFAPAAGR